MSRRWLSWYLLALVLLSASALVKRHLEHIQLAHTLAAQLLPLAETGANDDTLLERYFWGGSTQLANGNWYYGGSVQGPAVYLLRHGYMDDRLARAVLLTEARRLNDWQYTYPAVYNYDLRRYLIERCLRAYPSDLAIAWAAGSLSLAAGDDDIAVQQLARILRTPQQWASCVKLCTQLGVSPEHMLGRYCAALTLTGRDADAKYLAESLRQDAQLLGFFLRWDEDRHVTTLAELGPPKTYAPTSLRITRVPEWGEPQPVVPGVRELVQRYSVDPDPRWLKPIEESIRQVKQTKVWRVGAGANDETSDYLQSTNLDYLALEHLRAYIAARQWDQAERYIAQLKKMYRDRPDTLSYDQRYLAALFLLRIAQSDSLDASLEPKQPEDEYAFWPAQDGQYAGPFGSLRDRDLLVLIMRSPQFRAALSAAKRKPRETEITAATRPQRDTYYDYANGDIPQLARYAKGG